MSGGGTHERNTSGLLAHAHKKSEESYKRVLAAIDRLKAENRSVNYNSVAAESGLTKSYLYRHPELRERIDHFRQETSSLPATDKIIQTAGRKNRTLTPEQQGRLDRIEKSLKSLNEEFGKLQREMLSQESDTP